MKLNSKSVLVFLVMLLGLICILPAQNLKRFEIVPKATPLTSLQVDHPDCAVVIVHSAIQNLFFESNMGKIKAQAYHALESRYVIYLYPEKQRVAIKCPGFVQGEFPLFSDLKPRQNFTFEINEKLDITGKGDFTLKSDPPGADITIEQFPTFSEKTPYQFKQFGAQSYGIRLSKARYEPISANILIEANKAQSQTFKLVPEWADLIISSEPTGSSVYVNNILEGTTPLSLAGVSSGLDPGNYTIDLRPASQFYESFTQNITLRGNSKNEIDHKHKDISGYLRVNASPLPLEVRLNGNIENALAKGESIRLLNGSYNIEVINVGENKEYFKPYTESLSLIPGEEKQISVVLAINENIAPAMSHTSGNYSDPIYITFKDSQFNKRQIFYTLDGSVPNASALLFTDPILINKSTTLQAIAYTDQKASPITSATYIMQVAAPVFNPPDGSFSSPQQVAISSSTDNVTIYYTTDGSEPGISSERYSRPISITGNATLKAKAYKSGWAESILSTSNYIFEVAAPSFSPVGGIVSTNLIVTISCSTPEATIRYTLDGSEPSNSSPLYINSITVSRATTIKAKSFRSGWTDSSVKTAIYSNALATPTFNPAGGTYTSEQSVSISCAIRGATIRYTKNGSEPTETSNLYSSPLSITSTTTLKAKAFKTNYMPSTTATAVYTIDYLEDFENANFNYFPWSFSGSIVGMSTPYNPWTIVSGSGNSYSGNYGAISGSNPYWGHSTTIEFPLNFTNNGTISFWEKTSSLTPYDSFHFYVDNTEYGTYSSQTWTNHIYSISQGQHTFKWSFYKGYGYDQGLLGSAWLDLIEVSY